MECYKIPKISSYIDINYDPFLDEVLENPLKFNLNDKYVKNLAKKGNYLELGKKNIWLQFHYENFKRCRLVAYIEDNLFKIWSIVSTPKKVGIASKTLEFINEKIKNAGADLNLYAVDVWPIAKNFWKKMKLNKFIVGFEKSQITL